MTLMQEIQIHVDEGRFTAYQGSALTHLIENENLTLDQALMLTPQQLYNIAFEEIYWAILDDTYTLDQAFALTYDEIDNLTFPAICDLIDDDTLTLDQALTLTDYQQSQIVNHERVREELRTGVLTLEILTLVEQFLNDEPPVDRPLNINNEQSTHTASVNQSASASASRLMSSYSSQIKKSLPEYMIQIARWVNTLSNKNFKNQAAKRCIARLYSPDSMFTDPISGVTIHQLLVLTWVAIHDEVKRTSRLIDAEGLFLEGLYEIQRGNNLSELGIDTQEEDDDFICPTGTFNKFIEKLTGIHPDAITLYITSETQALKLPIVVQENTILFLASLSHPKNQTSFIKFLTILQQIKEQGVEIIWDSIKSKVAQDIFDEFGSLYIGMDDPKFINFIEAGVYTNLNPLPSFQKALSESIGYRKYCSSILKSSGVFSSSVSNTTPAEISKMDDIESETDDDIGISKGFVEKK